MVKTFLMNMVLRALTKSFLFLSNGIGTEAGVFVSLMPHGLLLAA